MNNTELKLYKNLRQITSSPQGRRIFLQSLPLLLAGCATNVQRHRQREGDNTGQETSVSVQDERRMSKEYIPKLLKEYPLVKNSYVQGHINHIGQRIVDQNSLRGKPYHYTFQVVDSKMVNAFALPGGPVYVTRPLILMANSEAELAGVVGHEIGHIKARHTAERIHKAEKEKSSSLLLGLGGVLIGGAAGFGLGKLLCKKQDKECLRRISLYGAAAGAAGGLLIQKFAFMAHGREDEMEADRIGFKTSMNANYHPQYIGKFYEKLLNIEKKHKGKSQNKLTSLFADALSTHPPTDQRVRQMNSLEREFSGKAGTISTNSFKKMQSILS